MAIIYTKKYDVILNIDNIIVKLCYLLVEHMRVNIETDLGERQADVFDGYYRGKLYIRTF